MIRAPGADDDKESCRAGWGGNHGPLDVPVNILVAVCVMSYELISCFDLEASAGFS